MSNLPHALFKDMPAGLDLQEQFAADAVTAATLPDPDPNDPRFSRFFVDLDANTQYYQAYGNSSRYMDISMALIESAAVKAWRQWAAREKGTDGAARRKAFLKAAADTQTGALVQEIDALMLTLLQRHFPGPAGNGDVAAEPYLGAMELFAKDQLPIDGDRLQRVGGGGEDVSHHRMDGFGMWFHWAAVFDIARFVSDGGGERPYRTLLVAAAAFGSAFDSAFRKRERTRPIYTATEGTNQRLRTDVLTWIQDAEGASSQARELYRIYMKLE